MTTLLLFLSAFLFPLPLLSPQDMRPSIALTPMVSVQDDETLDIIGQNIVTNLEFILKLTGDFQIVRADFLSPEYDLKRASIYYGWNNIGYSVFGTLERSGESGLNIAISIWNSSTPAETRSLSFPIDSIFEVFGVIDEVALNVARELTGKDLQFGEIVLENTGADGEYAVYIDNQYFGKNLRTVRVLSGERTVTVGVPGGFGDRILTTERVPVDKDNPVTVSFVVPRPVAGTGEGTGDGAGSPYADSGSTGMTAAERAIGSLEVNSVPSGAHVFLDGAEIGITPLSAMGVRAGKYELAIENPLFRQALLVADIRPDRIAQYTVDLEVDQNDPAVKGLMTSGTRGMLAGVSSMAAQTILGIVVLASGVLGDETDMTDTELILANAAFSFMFNARIGLFFVDSPWRALTVSGIGGGLFFLGRLLYESEDTQGIGIVTMILVPLASALLEVISPFPVSEKRNEDHLKEIEETGELPAWARDNPDHRWIVMVSGLDTLSGGIRIPVWPGIAAIDVLAGAGIGDITEPAFTVSGCVRAIVSPFGKWKSAAQPYLFCGMQGETDFSLFTLGLAAGMGLDFTVTDTFTLFAEWGYSGNANDGMDFRTSLGTRF